MGAPPVSKDPRDYPNLGLSHPIAHLKAVFNQIAAWPIEKQAEYADSICKAMTLNHERQSDLLDMEYEIQKMKKDPNAAKRIFSGFNTTTIGNIAFVAMNSSSVDEVRIALDVLNLFKKYKTGKLPK